MRRIGLLGGTFDPIHAGHMALAREALAYGLDEVWLLPSTPDYRNTGASGDQRADMVHLAIDSDPRLKLSKMEVKHPGTTAAVISRLCEKHPDCRFTFIIGADKLTSLPDWDDASELFRLCELMCFPRPGTDMNKYLLASVQAGAKFCIPDNAVKLDVSATRVREQVGYLQDPPEIDKKVLRYIAMHGLYQKNIMPQLTKMISDKRMAHTLGVRKTAVDLALFWNGPVLKAAVAALLHDCAKNMPLKESRALAVKKKLETDEGELTSNAMLHGPVGAYLAMDRFGITDPDVINAIRYHTVGRPGMSLLEKIIFVSDVIEPGRQEYDGLSTIRDAAYADIDKAVYLCLRSTRDYVLASGKPFYPVSLIAMRYYQAMIDE